MKKPEETKPTMHVQANVFKNDEKYLKKRKYVRLFDPYEWSVYEQKEKNKPWVLTGTKNRDEDVQKAAELSRKERAYLTKNMNKTFNSDAMNSMEEAGEDAVINRPMSDIELVNTMRDSLAGLNKSADALKNYKPVKKPEKKEEQIK